MRQVERVGDVTHVLKPRVGQGVRQRVLGEDANAGIPNPVMADVIKDWVEQLAIWPRDAHYVHKLPANVSFVMCQAEARAIGKEGGLGDH